MWETRKTNRFYSKTDSKYHNRYRLNTGLGVFFFQLESSVHSDYPIWYIAPQIPRGLENVGITRTYARFSAGRLRDVKYTHTRRRRIVALNYRWQRKLTLVSRRRRKSPSNKDRTHHTETLEIVWSRKTHRRTDYANVYVWQTKKKLWYKPERRCVQNVYGGRGLSGVVIIVSRAQRSETGTVRRSEFRNGSDDRPFAIFPKFFVRTSAGMKQAPMFLK